MFARSTTVVGDPGNVDAGITYIRDEIMPQLIAMDGCLGLSMIVDRDSGQCIATTSWRDQDSMRASEPGVTEMRTRAAEVIGGEPQVEEWEVAVMHRDHRAPEGSCCRVTWLRLGHADIDRGIEVFRALTMPEAEGLEGFCSASLLLNREAGRCCATVTFETREQMEATRDRAWAIRDRGVREAGVDIVDVAEFDLALAHLRLPELA